MGADLMPNFSSVLYNSFWPLTWFRISSYDGSTGCFWLDVVRQCRQLSIPWHHQNLGHHLSDQRSVDLSYHPDPAYNIQSYCPTTALLSLPVKFHNHINSFSLEFTELLRNTFLSQQGMEYKGGCSSCTLLLEAICLLNSPKGNTKLEVTSLPKSKKSPATLLQNLLLELVTLRIVCTDLYLPNFVVRIGILLHLPCGHLCLTKLMLLSISMEHLWKGRGSQSPCSPLR